MKPKEGWSFWLVMLTATTMLGLCFAATCRGQVGTFLADEVHQGSGIYVGQGVPVAYSGGENRRRIAVHGTSYDVPANHIDPHGYYRCPKGPSRIPAADNAQGTVYSIRGPDGIERFMDRNMYYGELERIHAAESRTPRARTGWKPFGQARMPELDRAPPCGVCKQMLTPRNPIDGSQKCWNKKCPAYGKKLWFVKPTAGQPPCPDCQIPRQPRYVPIVPPSARQPQSQANPAVCRIRSSEGNGQAMGTGTLVDVENGYGLVVSAQHVFRGGGENVICEFPNGKRMAAKHVADKDRNDIAALLIRDPGIKPIDVSTQGPQMGEAASSAGYGGQGKYLANYGRVVNVSGTQFEISGAARGGDSGGPVLDGQGRLIGVLWGTDGHTVVATSSVTTDGFLQRAGRYLLPWNSHDNNKNFGPPGSVPMPLPPAPLPPQIIMPPQQQGQCPVVDLGPINTVLQQHAADIASLKETQAKAKELAEKWPALKEEVAKLPGITKDVENATACSQDALGNALDAKAKLDSALDEDNPKGLFARLKDRIGQATGISKVLGWLGISLSGSVAIGGAIAILIVLIRRGEKRVAAGDPTLMQRAAARTSWTWDDAIADKEAALLRRVQERIHPSWSQPAPTAQPPTPPAGG